MKIIATLLVLFFCACGYTPMSVATSNALGDSVSVKTVINKIEPKDSILLNDRFINYLEHYLQKIVSKNADSSIVLRLLNSDFIPLYYDELGNAKSYKAIIRLEFVVTYKDGIKEIIITEGEHVFNTNNISVLSDEQKSKAIDIASQKAFDEFALKIVL